MAADGVGDGDGDASIVFLQLHVTRWALCVHTGRIYLHAGLVHKGHCTHPFRYCVIGSNAHTVRNTHVAHFRIDKNEKMYCVT